MVKINQLEVENLKRIKSCVLEPTESGLTVIGGRNGQGKTSVLDAIAWALGGEKFRPSAPNREGSVIPPEVKITLSNGLVVERKGKNSSLRVTDINGNRSGQQLLNDFVEQLALNLPKFMNATNKEKAATLLSIIGVRDQLTQLEQTEHELYNQRLLVGREGDRKAKYAAEMPSYDSVPDVPISAAELIRQQQEILARNGENQRLRDAAEKIKLDYNRQFGLVQDLEAKLSEARTKLASLDDDLQTASRCTADLQDESTAELEASIEQIEAINVKVRANLDKAKAEEEARHYGAQYENLSKQIDEVRSQKTALLEGANLPLPGLSVQDRELTYNGAKWDCMSGAEQLKVATAIVRALNPSCGFVLMDKLEQMDLDTMREFGAWLEQEGLQVIATRVSTGPECSIIIEDGLAAASEATPSKAWKEGVF